MKTCLSSWWPPGIHPDLIPNEVGCIIPEPEEPFVERAPPLFLSSLELIHSKRDTLQFRAVFRLHLLEVREREAMATSS
jgi:hypothetical protein